MTDRNVHKLPGIEGPESAAALAEMINGPLLTSGLIAHFDGDNSPITTADATDLATLKTLILDMTNAFVAHGVNVAQHSVADAALDVPAGFVTHPLEPDDLAECQAVNNVLKIDFNAHIINATPHRGGGEQGGFSATAVSTTDGSNQATNETLANALKAAFNIHIKSGVQTFNRIEP